MLFSSLKKGLTPKICVLCFVIINSGFFLFLFLFCFGFFLVLGLLFFVFVFFVYLSFFNDYVFASKKWPFR